MTKNKAAKAAVTGILGALALALSFLEGLLPPLPMTPPGFKLGLSNIVTMYAAGSIGLPCAVFLALLKGGFAFITRGVYAGSMSLSGGVVSTICAYLLLRKTKVSYMLVGVCGAFAHNAAQLLCAYFITTTSVVFYVPVLLLLSIFSGVITGAVLSLIIPRLKKVEIYLGKDL